MTAAFRLAARLIGWIGKQAPAARGSTRVISKLLSTRPVAIAGGGIGGLACAVALARRGFRCCVLEQAPAFGEVGVGLQVAPNAMAVLQALGVGEAKRTALAIDGLQMIDAVSGATFFKASCGEAFRERFGNPYSVAHRADIHGALLQACQASDLIELRTGARVASFDLGTAGVSIRLATGETVEAPALIGADGIGSSIRGRILAEDTPPCLAGVIYRALIPAAAMPSEEQKSGVTLWAGEGTHVIYYPIRDRSAFNFAAIATDKTLLARGEGGATRAEVLEAVRPTSDALRRLVEVPEGFNRYLIRYREPVVNWTRGPVTLLGDAAHPMVHYLAQGAAMALEDAICLAEITAEASGDFAAAFQRYQSIRIIRSTRVQISSLMLDQVLHAGGVERLVRNSIFSDRTDEEHYDRFSWLYTSPWYVR